MRSIRARVLGAVAVVIGVGIANIGCASHPEDAGAADESNMTAATPITLGNYLNHPRIVAVRQIVDEVDHSPFTQADHGGCDMTNTKWTDSAGKIRKYKNAGGEGGGFGETTSYYDATFKPRFVFDLEVDLEALTAFEHRVWIENGQVIFETMRDGKVNKQTSEPDFTGAVDRAPRPAEAFHLENATDVTDPEAAFKMTGCPDPDK